MERDVAWLAKVGGQGPHRGGSPNWDWRMWLLAAQPLVSSLCDGGMFGLGSGCLGQRWIGMELVCVRRSGSFRNCFGHGL
jgi:hypothetical protein